MKIKLLAVALVALFTLNNAIAQEQGDISVNGGIGYVFSPFSDDGRIGFGGGAEYVSKDGMSGALDIIHTVKTVLK